MAHPKRKSRDDGTLEAILSRSFGMDPETADPEVVVRAAEFLMWGAGVPAAQRQLARINERRVAAGAKAVMPGRGHVLSWDG
jgi:hypothetical protein